MHTFSNLLLFFDNIYKLRRLFDHLGNNDFADDIDGNVSQRTQRGLHIKLVSLCNLEDNCFRKFLSLYSLSVTGASGTQVDASIRARR